MAGIRDLDHNGALAKYAVGLGPGPVENHLSCTNNSATIGKLVVTYSI